MNEECEIFRRHKLADPALPDLALHRHVAGCSACARLARDIDAFDLELQSALRVAVPANLVHRVLARQRGRARGRAGGRAGGRAIWARLRAAFGLTSPLGWITTGGVAAMAVLVAGMVLMTARPGIDPAARAVIAHVVSEPKVAFVRELVEPLAVAEAFARVGGRLEGSLGEVRYLGSCILDGQEVQHLLVQFPEGQAQLILLPGAPRRGEPQSAQGWNAVVIPLKRGSLGIVTQSREAVLRARERVEQAVRVEG
jgi:hypothetical protein